MALATTCIVVPCFNEAKRFDSATFATFGADHPTYSFLFVNDGSTDGTARLLDGLAGANSRVSVLHCGSNRGKAEAVRQGMLRAVAEKYSFVGFLDADLATPLSELVAMHEYLIVHSELQLVMGSRVMLLGRAIDRHPWRHYLGRMFATCVSLSISSPVYDTQCGAKVFRVNPKLGIVLQDSFSSKWIFDVEMLARLAKEYGIRGRELGKIVIEHPVMSWSDVGGSKVRPRDFLRAIAELFGIFRRFRRDLR